MELCTCPADSVCSWNLREKLKDELIRGHELANQLHFAVGNGDGGSADGLVTKIESTFTTCISLLSGNHQSKGELIQVNTVAPPIVDSSCRWGALEAINSGGSSKKRKTSRSWSKDAPDFIDDGYAWRKYGQKEILNARNPRSYFRCSHKYDQGCKAIKHVQKLDDDPELFRTTYYGNHTCSNSFIKAPQSVLDTTSSTEVPGSDFMIICDNTSNRRRNNQEQPLFLSTGNKLVESSHTIGNQSSLLSSSDYLVSPDTVVFMPSEPISEMPPEIELDQQEDMTFGAEMEHFFFDEEILPYELW